MVRADDHGGGGLLDELDATTEVRELLESLRTGPDPRDALGLALALRERLGEPQGYEARRVTAARHALDAWLGRRRPAPALLADPQARIALTFGGQGSSFVDELAHLVRRSPAADRLVRALADRVRGVVADLSPADRAWFAHGMDPLRWLEDPTSRPPAAYLASSPVSQPLIFATQVGHYAALLEAGYDRPELAERTVAATGHSQGIMAAIL
ncbi:MAG: hypothetical protein H6735_11845 [Alphaproteobacteria bacterium]|nr:hypothetical protein [Alphaproteobacteria bacterium]